MSSGENKQIDAASGSGDTGGPLDVLLSRALLPSDGDEQVREAFDLAQVRSAIAASAKRVNSTPKRKRISNKRIQRVRPQNWVWAAGAAALLAGSLTGWLLIPSHQPKAPDVVQTPKKDVSPEREPAPPADNRVVKADPIPVPTPIPVPVPVPTEKHDVVVTPTPPKPQPKVESDSSNSTVVSSQTPTAKLPTVDSGHGLAATASIADTKLVLGFNYNCAATGCQIENSVYAKNGVAYVEMKFAKNASVFGMKDGGIQYYIYDLAAKTVTVFDPASRTYFMQKNRELAADTTYVLLGMLAKSSNPDELLAYKKKSGVITTSVLKAQKNADFKDELLKVPAGFSEVSPPKN